MGSWADVDVGAWRCPRGCHSGSYAVTLLGVHPSLSCIGTGTGPRWQLVDVRALCNACTIAEGTPLDR